MEFVGKTGDSGGGMYVVRILLIWEKTVMGFTLGFY